MAPTERTNPAFLLLAECRTRNLDRDPYIISPHFDDSDSDSESDTEFIGFISTIAETNPPSLDLFSHPQYD